MSTNEQGVSRVVELENVLGEILDLWERELLEIDAPGADELDGIVDVFDHARTVLACGEEDEEGY